MSCLHVVLLNSFQYVSIKKLLIILRDNLDRFRAQWEDQPETEDCGVSWERPTSNKGIWTLNSP